MPTFPTMVAQIETASQSFLLTFAHCKCIASHMIYMRGNEDNCQDVRNLYDTNVRLVPVTDVSNWPPINVYKPDRQKNVQFTNQDRC